LPTPQDRQHFIQWLNGLGSLRRSLDTGPHNRSTTPHPPSVCGCNPGQSGCRFFTGAHQSGGGWTAYMALVQYQLSAAPLAQLAAGILSPNMQQLQQAYELIRQLANMGPFFSYQVIADLCDNGCLPPHLNKQLHVWVCPGNGALAGLSRIFPVSTCGGCCVFLLLLPLSGDCREGQWALRDSYVE
jgi:hypothetical protein